MTSETQKQPMVGREIPWSYVRDVHLRIVDWWPCQTEKGGRVTVGPGVKAYALAQFEAPWLKGRALVPIEARSNLTWLRLAWQRQLYLKHDIIATHSPEPPLRLKGLSLRALPILLILRLMDRSKLHFSVAARGDLDRLYSEGGIAMANSTIVFFGD